MNIGERIEYIIERLTELSYKLEAIDIRIAQLRQTINGLERYRFVNAVESLLDDAVYSFENAKVEIERDISRIRSIVNDMIGRLDAIILRLDTIEELVRVVSVVASIMKEMNIGSVERIAELIDRCKDLPRSLGGG